MDSPFLLRFGTRQCGNMAHYQIEFVSKSDGLKHKLLKRIPAPVDPKQHMYTLIWNAEEDSYEIEQDGELYHLGVISTDFSDF